MLCSHQLDAKGGWQMALNLIAWLRERKLDRESRDVFGSAADEELYALLDEASKVSTS
jgi:hypothetical protein